MLNLVKQLKAAGTPIDGVGFQVRSRTFLTKSQVTSFKCHFTVGGVPKDFQNVLEQFTALGVEVAITELDIRMKLPETAALQSQQQTDYENVVKACVAVKGCVGVTLWDFSDKVSCCFLCWTNS